MLSKLPALLAAAAFAVQSVPAAAQTEAPAGATEAQQRALGLSSFLRSDLILILAAVAGAALVNVLLIAVDKDDDDQPVSP